MAAKDKKPAAKKATSQTKVTRISARDTETKKKIPATKKEAAEAVQPKKAEPKKRKDEKKRPHNNLAAPFAALGRYFKGAWYELQQVTWPNRKATWSMTLALLIYTAFFVVIILLLDALFKYLLELILG